MKLRGLYAIVDTGLLAAAGIEPIAFAKEILSVHPAALQLRAKSDSDEEIVSLARALAPLCAEQKVPFVLNDRSDLARAAEIDFVHLGQDDAIETASQMKIGRSTHSPEQLARALETQLAYVAFGPIFPTASKKNPDPVVGLGGLSRAREIISESAFPETSLVAIGGISLENAAKIAEFADSGAVIGALIGDGFRGLRARAEALHEKLGGHR
jgi:thiamine-phosphate pyrophosphorylase